MSAILFLILRVILAAALYAFLGLAIYLMWKDIKLQGSLLAARQLTPITLSTESSGLNLSRQYSCPEIILGREASCDFALGDQTVSSRHARLSFRHSQWWLEDMTSTNGTFLNGEAVTTPVVITHSDVLRLGQVEVRVDISPVNLDGAQSTGLLFRR